MIPLASWFADGVPDLSNCEGGALRPLAPDDRQDELMAEKYDLGYRDGLAKAYDDCNAALEAERQRLSTAIEAEHERWWSEEAVRIVQRLDTAIVDLRKRLEESLSQLLQPFLGDCIATRAITEFADQLKSYFDGRGAALIRLHIPPEWQERLQMLLADKGISLDMGPAPAGECRSVCDDESFETCIQTWLSLVRTLSHV